MDDEKIFISLREVKYLFKKSQADSKYLVVTFSAFAPEGTPPHYNYVRTLDDIDCNTLFILDDFGSRGSYYLGQNGDRSIEWSVIKLIESISTTFNIRRENIITCGSSKGGYAALYYAIKYGFGNAIVGSPQTLIGEYLISYVRQHEIAKFIIGDMQNPKEHLDNILKQAVLDSEYKPKLYIHVGKDEYHYFTHVLPLLEWIKQKNIPFDLDLGDYSKHSEVINFYPSYLSSTVKFLLGSSCIIKVTSNKESPQKPGTKILWSIGSFDGSFEYGWYILKNGERIGYIPYSTNNYMEWLPEESGMYSIKVFVRDQDGSKRSYLSEVFLIEP